MKNVDLEALKEVLEMVVGCVQLRPHSKREVLNFIQNGDFSVLSDEAKEELSLVYRNIILPSYQRITNNSYLPNIFASLGD